MPGLVDAHCHVGLESTGAVPDDVAEQHALAERSAGALLLRDAGSPADTRWMDEREDLPRIVRAGRHIARPKRYLRNYADEVEPDALVTAVERQAARGDGWVKLVGDWIDREVGDLTPLWPAEVAKAGIDRAHELGCRVTAHVFGEQAVAELVEAGIDGIEHGTGLDEPTIALMAERRVALVPTMIQLENFPGFAEPRTRSSPRTPAGSGRCTSGGWRRSAPRSTPASRSTPGTDAGGYLPHGIVGREIAAHGRVHVGRAGAGRGFVAGPGLAGPPRRARRGGARPTWSTFDEDPRADLRVLSTPAAVVLRGRRVA